MFLEAILFDYTLTSSKIYVFIHLHTLLRRFLVKNRFRRVPFSKIVFREPSSKVLTFNNVGFKDGFEPETSRKRYGSTSTLIFFTETCFFLPKTAEMHSIGVENPS